MQYRKQPDAVASVKGKGDSSDICGEVRFYQKKCAVLVVAQISGLPKNGAGFFGFHVHEGDSCKGNAFEQTGGHLNPTDAPHPKHMGDLPPLLSCSGSAYMQVKTDRFHVRDIIGKTVVIHGGTDDFRSQPSGDAGAKIACGVIRAV